MTLASSVDLLAGGGDEFFLLLLGGAQLGLELLGLVLQRLVAGEAFLNCFGLFP
jgi:hypothetical protein